MKKLLNSIIDLVLSPYRSWKRKKLLRKKIEQLKKQDPFIYD